MGWTERQRGMLAAMGLRVWEAEGSAVAQADAGPTAAAVHAKSAEVAAARAVGAGAGAGAGAGSADGVDVARVAPAAQARPDRVTTPPPPAQTAARVPDAAPPEPSPATPASPAALSERALQIAAMDWPALRESVAGCRACSLCESRSQTVFGVGHERAQWMIVGEAPGENEDLQGEPFVGKAGQLLDNMLRALQLTRQPGSPAQQVFIANTLKCRPPRNRNPGLDELAQCEPYLQRQIELIKPRVILAMGKFAVKALLGSDEAIGRLRGRVHDHRGTPVIVTYHPAYLLRQLGDKARAWEDLCLAASRLEG